MTRDELEDRMRLAHDQAIRERDEALDALRNLDALVRHETGLPESARNGVVADCGTDEGIYRAGMILEEVRAVLAKHGAQP